MNPNNIDPKDFYDLKISSTICSEYRMGWVRQIIMQANTTETITKFIVLDHNEVVIETNSIDDAVDAYNNIQNRW
jgi:hypothetical protein